MRKLGFWEEANRLDLDALLQKISRLRICILGDLCLDVYWHADMRRSTLSRETPHYPLPVVSERFSPGGAANVCANAAALGAGQVQALGVTGDDWRGDILRKCCAKQGIGTSSVVMEPGRFTNAYCKPIRRGISQVAYEDPRLDFCTLAPVSEKTEALLLDALDHLDADVLCVSDQLEFGCITPRIRQKICQLGQSGLLVLADSRDRIGSYTGVMVKPNEIEAYTTARGTLPPEDVTLDDYLDCARQIWEKTGNSVFMTLGEQGCAYIDGGDPILMEAARAPEQIDFVGAGDTMLAALSLALAAGASPAEAMLFGNLSASVTIGKIGTTGTASPEELRAARERQLLLLK